MKIYINPNTWADVYEIYITEEDAHGVKQVVKPMKLEFEEMKFGEICKPSLSVERFFGRETNFLQALADALANAGYKAKSAEENEGELKATKLHLNDMRKIVFEEGK